MSGWAAGGIGDLDGLRGERSDIEKGEVGQRYLAPVLCPAAHSLSPSECPQHSCPLQGSGFTPSHSAPKTPTGAQRTLGVQGSLRLEAQGLLERTWTSSFTPPTLGPGQGLCTAPELAHCGSVSGIGAPTW